MKYLILPILLLIFSNNVFAEEDLPEVKQGVRMVHGFYFAYTNEFTYYADTVAQLCYITPRSGGLPPAVVTIPCKNLKRRPEWAKIITWE